MSKFFITLLIGIIAALPCGFAQNKASDDITRAFAQAYTMHPNLPKGLLESMAEAASHTQNLAPSEGMDHHHGPARFGLFALVEDGEGYFKNTLVDVCTATHTDINEFKKSPIAQILSVAAYLDLQTQENVWALRTAKPLAMALCEIPDNNIQNAYAREQYAYAIYTEIEKYEAAMPRVGLFDMMQKKGCAGTEFLKQISLQKNWFSDGNFAVLSGKSVMIKGGKIIGENGTLFVRPNTDNAQNNRQNSNNSIFTTDYAPALWVASPNFSSRSAVAISAVTIHTTEGSYAGSISWFQNTASQVSAHYVIRSSDGQVTQCVLESNKAWHVGSENPYTIGIEHEGYVAQTTWYTTAMYNSSAALVRDICASGYGILPTTCYNGASSSGGNVLATSIKIKGHQHFANQTHVDPGINWNWALYYSLINPCAAPTGLTASNATVSSVNLAWTAVAGAASYTVEYKTAAATTWTALAATTAITASLTGLSNATTYNWRVKTNCSATVSSVATNGSNFTTLTPPCNVPTSLATSAISATACTFTWVAVSGAASYTLQYKTSAATTWTSLNVTGTTYRLTGLASSTLYNWQLMTNCATNASAYATGANFTTLAPPCIAPTGLTSSNIFTTKATIAWAAVTGATSYQVEYKTSAATTWTVATQTTTSTALTGLAAATAYQFRVKTVCSVTSSSAYSTTGTFTTAPSCYDANEANNASSTATPLASGTFKYGKLCSTTTTADADWYSVTTTAASSTIVVNLTELPANYNLDLYVNGAWVAASATAGTANESLTRTAQPAGTYLFRVYSATTADVNSLLDYKIAASVTPTANGLNAGNTAEMTEITAKSIENLDNLRVIPNPLTDVSQLYFDLKTPQNVLLQVTDNIGRIIFSTTKTYDAGIQSTELLTNEWSNGVYFVTLKGETSQKSVKVIK